MAKTKLPPPPPKLPAKEEVAPIIRAQSQQDDEQAEGSAVDDIRSDLQDAYESIASAWEKLDTLEAQQ